MKSVSGILTADLDVVCHDTVDPFLEADELMELGHLIEKTGSDVCPSNEFAIGDNDLPICAEKQESPCTINMPIIIWIFEVIMFGA